MKLPNSSKAILPKEKLSDYLLSETHAGGKSKAKFFRSVGFNEINLEKSLLKIATDEEVKNISESIHGIKYVVEGKVHTPSRRIVKIRTVWIIEPYKNAPRLVTAYPV